MFFIFGVSVFVGWLPHKKGVRILDLSFPINHSDSKWRVKYLALFVVGAAFLRPGRCKLFRFVFSDFLEFPAIFCKKAFMSRTLQFFANFNFDILLTVLDVFHFVCFIFCWGLPHKNGVCILDYFLVLITLIQSGG